MNQPNTALLADMEVLRRKFIRNSFEWVALIAGLALSAAFLARTEPLLAWGAPILGLIASVALVSKLRGNFLLAYKSALIPGLLSSVATGLRYDASKGVSADEFRAMELYAGPDRYSSGDLFEGQVGATSIRFGTVLAEERHESKDSKGNTETTYTTIFSGVMVIVDFNKSFSGKTRIWKRGLHLIDRLRGTIVRLEDPRFNEAFTVTTDDQVEARYLLTLSMMERMVALRAAFGSLQLSFKGGALYIALEELNRPFDPAIGASVADGAELRRIEATLRKLVGIVDTLDLNTRIWSKGMEQVDRMATA